MIERYTLNDPKPTFKDRAVVVVDMTYFGGDGIKVGHIVGKSMSHIFDLWIVQFDKDFGPTYPYKVCTIPHTAFIKTMPINEFIAALDKERGTTTDPEVAAQKLKEFLAAHYTDKK